MTWNQASCAELNFAFLLVYAAFALCIVEDFGGGHRSRSARVTILSKRRSEWVVSRAVALTVLLLAAASLGLSISPALATTKITLLYVPINPFAGSWIAKDQGYFEKHGLDVDLILAPSGGGAISGLIAGSAQIGVTTPSQLLQADEQGLDLVILAGTTVFPVTPHSTGVLARSNSDIKTVTDLIGKKVAMGGFGSATDVIAKKWVQSNGLDYHNVKWVEIQFPQMGDALKAGLVDAVVSTNPFQSRILANNIGYEVVDLNSVPYKGTMSTAYISTRSWALKNAETISAFRAALDEATDYLNEPTQTDSIRATIAKYSKLPPEIVATLPIPTNVDAHAKPEGMAFWIEASREQGLITGNPDPASLIAP